MSSQRKLAAIMFTDIVGYTALMARDEGLALEMLRQNRKVHLPLIAQFGGRFLKEMGDGILAAFENSSHAVLCAAAIRQASAAVNISLRIAVHQGEVLFEDGDVFGDGVNIASRIETLAEPGQILITDAVRNNLQNKPGIESELVAETTLKNAPGLWKVYAVLVDDDLLETTRSELATAYRARSRSRSIPVPARWLLLGLVVVVGGVLLWTNNGSGRDSAPELIRDKRIAVMLIDNQTQDASRDPFGIMISDWLSQSLMQLEGTKVVLPASVRANAYLTEQDSVGTSFADRTGAGVLIDGRYYMQGGQLTVHLHVTNAYTGEIYKSFRSAGDPDSELQILDELTQRVVGYWASRDFKRFNQRPPSYEAYKKLNLARETWGADFVKTETLLKEALLLDPAFHTAKVRLLILYNVLPDYRKRDSLFDLMASSDQNLTSWEQAEFNSIKAFMRGDRVGMARWNLELYHIDPWERISNYRAAAWQLACVNHPQKAIEIFFDFPDPYGRSAHTGAWRSELIMDALYAIGKYDEMLTTLDSIELTEGSFSIAANHLRALVHMGRRDEALNTLRSYVLQPNRNVVNVVPHPAWYAVIVCNTAAIVDDRFMLKQAAAELESLADQSESHYYDYFMGLAAFWREDFRSALTHFEDLSTDRMHEKSFPTHCDDFYWPIRRLALIGICHAKLGDDAQAKTLITRILETPYYSRKFGYHAYHAALIHCALDHPEEALEYLRSYMTLSPAPFVLDHLDQDPLLKPLFDRPEFQAMVQPVG